MNLEPRTSVGKWSSAAEVFIRNQMRICLFGRRGDLTEAKRNQCALLQVPRLLRESKVESSSHPLKLATAWFVSNKPPSNLPRAG